MYCVYQAHMVCVYTVCCVCVYVYTVAATVAGPAVSAAVAGTLKNANKPLLACVCAYTREGV